MRRNLVTLIVAAVALVGMSAGLAPNVQSSDASITYYDGMPVVVLAGDPGDRGRAYGVAVPGMIRDNLAGFWAAAEGKGLSREGLVSKAREHEDTQPERMLAELLGMAEGSGVSYDELLAMNMFSPSVKSSDGCTIFAATGEGAVDGQTVASKNRDANAPNVLLVVEPYGELHGFVAVTGAGEWGVSFGLNDAGLCDGNNWMPVPDYYDDGIGELPMNRMALEECSSVSEAIEFVYGIDKYGGSTLMVADQHEAAFIETVSTLYETDEVDDTAYEMVVDRADVHTNHYTLQPFVDWVLYEDFGYFWIPSIVRYDRGIELIEENDGVVSADLVMSFTRDLDDYANSQPLDVVYAHPEIPHECWNHGWPGFSISNTRTVSAGVFEIDGTWPGVMSTMWTSINNPCYTPYFPVHNGLILEAERVSEGLSDYMDSSVWKLASLLRSGTFNTWDDTALLMDEWEAGAIEQNELAEAQARSLMVLGEVPDAAAVLADSDIALGRAAVEYMLSLA